MQAAGPSGAGVLTSVLNVGPTGDMRKTFDFSAITHSFVAAVLSALPY